MLFSSNSILLGNGNTMQGCPQAYTLWNWEVPSPSSAVRNMISSHTLELPSFKGFEMLSMHENSSWKYKDESAVFLRGICTLWLCFINSIWPGFQFQSKTKIFLWDPSSPNPRSNSNPSLFQEACLKARSSFTIQNKVLPWLKPFFLTGWTILTEVFQTNTAQPRFTLRKISV